MAKKITTKKTLKSLFSKSEANVSETVEKSNIGSGGGGVVVEKKKFKFPGLKIKSKSGASESVQVQSAAKPGVNNGNSSDNVSTDTDRSSLYGTAPRSKGKELSLSEMDLTKSKPKRFATFSLGALKKKKKKDDGILSKSTFGIDSSGFAVRQEASNLVNQLDQTNRILSMSQPELDTSEVFDIPSPPPVASNKPEFALSNQSHASVTVHTRSIEQPQTNIQNTPKEMPKAPIATMPELNLDVNQVNAGIEEATPNISTYKEEANAALSKVEKTLSDFKAPELVTGNIAKFEDGKLQESNMKPNTTTSKQAQSEKQVEISATATTDPKMASTVSDKQLIIDALPTVDPKMSRTVKESQLETNTTAATGSKMASTVLDKQLIIDALPTVDPKMSRTVKESQLETNTTVAIGSKMASTVTEYQLDSSTLPTEPMKVDAKMSASISEPTRVSTSDKYTISQTATSEKIPKDLSSEATLSPRRSTKKVDPSVGREVYGALYDSLFPDNFNSEVISSLLPQPPKLSSEYRRLQTASETVLVKTFDGQHAKCDTLSSPLSTSSPEKTGDIVAESSSSYSKSASKTVSEEPTKDAPKTVYIRKVTHYDITSDTKPINERVQIAYSELAQFNLDTQCSDNGFLEDNSAKSSVAVSPAPPHISTCATSQETNAQVTSNTQKKVVLVKELVTDEGSRDSGCPTPVMEKLSKSPDMKMDESEVFSVTSRQTEGCDGICSPAYLSVGSDDGSAIYYSAEEDNADEEELFTMDERESTIIDTMKDVSTFEDLVSNRTIITREEGNVTVHSGENAFDFQAHGGSEVEVHGGSGMSEAEVMKAENEKQAEFLATPVLQEEELVVDPPFAERHGPGKDGLGTSQISESELQSNDVLARDDELDAESVERSDSWHAITPRLTEAVNLVLSSHKYDTKSLVADNSEKLSDAAGLENNGTVLSVEEVDTVTQWPGRSIIASAQEQVAVQLSGEGNNLEILQVMVKREEALSQEQQDLSEGSLPSTQTPTTSLLIKENPSDTASVDLDDNMSSGYSSLSTTLSLRSPSSSQTEDPTYRFKKVSLVSDSSEINQDTVDYSNTTAITPDTNGEDLDTSVYKWKNRFKAVHQFKPDSCEYTIESTSSTIPEARDYSISSIAENDSTLSGQAETGSRRGIVTRWAEFSTAPAGDSVAQSEGETYGIRSLDSTDATIRYSTHLDQEEEVDDTFSGVFKATLVDLEPESPIGAFPQACPIPEDIDSPSQCEMDSLVDTLKNMGPSLRVRSLSARGPQSNLMSSLPPIREDAPSPVTADVKNKTQVDGLNGIYSLPPDIGLKSSLRDARSPLELMKQSLQEQQVGSRSLTLPLRASASSSIVMRGSSDSPSDDLPSPVHLQNGIGSRLDNSILFSSLRASSIDQTSENGKPNFHRSLFRASSLPDIGQSNDRMSMSPKDSGNEIDPSATATTSRLSFLYNSSSSSLTGSDDYASRISRPPSLIASIGSPTSSNSPTVLLSPTGSIELNRTFHIPDSLQRSFSGGDSGFGSQLSASMFNSVQAGSQFQSQELEQERNLLSKYRAFPDAYLTKTKEHGKLNPRPGKMYIFDRPGMCGQRIEVRSDVGDATSWELEETISISVIRGGWVLYEKPNFKGEKIALDEGEIELTYPWTEEEELVSGQVNGQVDGQVNGQVNGQTLDEKTNEETSEETKEEKPVRRFIIGSVRRAVRDYSVPDISLFPEENAEGKKVIFRDTSEDARIFGFPIKATSIVINAGLWLVYAQPFFQGIPRVLEVGGYSNPEAWGVEKPYVGSLHPLKIGEPRVENMGEPKMVVYEKPYFCGKSRTIMSHSRDFMTRVDQQQQAFMNNVGSLKVIGGIWVGYEKEGFRGHQYLLEEGDYQDWRVWGGCDSELRSVRVIRADLSDSLMVMFEQPEEEQEEMQEENTFEVTEAIPDVELFGFKTSTRSIHVLSGAWIAYSHVDFSGSQYILEKGFYNNCADWGSQDNRICSLQPILMVPRDNTKNRNEIFLYTEPDFQGKCYAIDRNQGALSDKLLPKSCRVAGGSWVLYENKQFAGKLYVLSEGDYPNLTSMGCPASSFLRSVKAVPMSLSVPSISLFGLECLEGREITLESEVFSLVEGGYNNHILSVRVNSGCWVICEHSNYRGHQFLLEPIEITNWPKFSSLQTIGSMYPVRQKRSLFRIKQKELGQFMSVQGGVEEMKTGRVVVSPEAEPMSDIWYYQDGLIKNKLSQSMSLQVMGNVEPAAKVVLWTETRQPIQMWAAQMRGLITSLTFPGMVLDVKGGKTYDKNHVVIMPEDEDRPSQQWEIELL